MSAVSRADAIGQAWIYANAFYCCCHFGLHQDIRRAPVRFVILPSARRWLRQVRIGDALISGSAKINWPVLMSLARCTAVRTFDRFLALIERDNSLPFSRAFALFSSALAIDSVTSGVPTSFDVNRRGQSLIIVMAPEAMRMLM